MMSSWQIKAYEAEAISVSNDWTLSDDERNYRLEMIHAEIRRLGGEPYLEREPKGRVRATRTSKEAVRRRKS